MVTTVFPTLYVMTVHSKMLHVTCKSCYPNTYMEWEGVMWTHLAQNGEQWQALVNTVMNL